MCDVMDGHMNWPVAELSMHILALGWGMVRMGKVMLGGRYQCKT